MYYKRLYTMAEVASKLAIPTVGANNLYYYLKQFGIINEDCTPVSKYIYLGYFEMDTGTRNKFNSKTYRKTMTTECGLKWLFEEIRDRILIEQKIYFESLKTKV